MKQQGLWQFISEQHGKLLSQVLQHLGLTFASLALAIIIGVPVGIFIARKRSVANAVLGVAGVLQTVPSIALLGFMIPVFGIGAAPAIVALLIYALLPIIRNTYTGITGVNASVVEAARAMGMSNWQLLTRIELPLSLPVIVAGIRTAAVINVGVATLASFVAAGGLGEFIFGGISLNNTNMILAGAIPAAILAILVDQLIAIIQRSGLRSLKKYLIVLAAVIVAVGVSYLLPEGKNAGFKSGFTPEFMGRQDGDLGLRSVYGLQVNPVIVSDAIMYKALHDGELDMVSGYSTDGRIKEYDLLVLTDDKRIFPPYYAAPIIKTSTLKKFPELGPALDLLAGRINDSAMTELNYRTDILNESPEKVAREFLTRQDLYKPARNGSNGTVRIGSKIFGEQYILAEIYRMLIEGNTDYKVETKTGLGGTKICFDALVSDGIDFYPEYTGTGLLVLLQPPSAVVEKVTETPEQTYQYVNEQFLSQFGIQWLKPIGFNNAYALMMRRRQAEELNIGTISGLKAYLDKQ